MENHKIFFYKKLSQDFNKTKLKALKNIWNPQHLKNLNKKALETSVKMNGIAEILFGSTKP